LETLLSLVRTINAGSDGVNREDLTNSLLHLESALENVNSKLRIAYDALWNEVRNDDVPSPSNKGSNC